MGGGEGAITPEFPISATKLIRKSYVPLTVLGQLTVGYLPLGQLPCRKITP